MAKSQNLATLEKIKAKCLEFFIDHNAYWFKILEQFLQELDTVNLITEPLFLGCFPFPLTQSGLFPPVDAIATAFSVFTEVILDESVDNAHNWQISCSFPELTASEAVKVNSQFR